MSTIQDNKVMETPDISPLVVPIKSMANIVANTPQTTTTEITEITEITETNQESEFTRVNVEALGNNVRLVDSDEDTGLALFCYTRCGPTDVGLIRQCRGVVFHNSDIVMKAFPYTVEYSVSNTDEINENINPVFSDCSFYDSHEGALIRMFNFGGKWFTSTHRKLDAFRSKWASQESFGSTFNQALEVEAELNSEFKNSLPGGSESLIERFQSILDVNKQYMFLVRNTSENRIVCDPPGKPTLFHVGTFVLGELVMTENINIPYPRKHTFSDVEEMSEYIDQINPSCLQGVIVFAPDNKQYKIFHKEYLELFKARGNEPSIKFRYLQVRMNHRLTNMLYYLYPDKIDQFDKYENALYAVAKYIYNSYVSRFIHKKRVDVPKQEYAVLHACHAWHLQDRINNRISQEKVIEVLNNQQPTSLNQMIRRFHMEQIIRQKAQENIQENIQTPQYCPLLVTENNLISCPPPPPSLNEENV
jgi:hypothetical protein